MKFPETQSFPSWEGENSGILIQRSNKVGVLDYLHMSMNIIKLTHHMITKTSISSLQTRGAAVPRINSNYLAALSGFNIYIFLILTIEDA